MLLITFITLLFFELKLLAEELFVIIIYRVFVFLIYIYFVGRLIPFKNKIQFPLNQNYEILYESNGTLKIVHNH